MIFDLSKPLPTRANFKGKNYALDLKLATVLKVYDILHSSELDAYEKNSMFLALLVREHDPPPELLKYVFDEYISITKKNTDSRTLRCVDFKQDGIYIYSSFMHDYGIDLVKKRDKMHWWQFVSLFYGLSKETKIREVMQIRSCEFPAPTKYNGKYIADLAKLKQYYALDLSQEEREYNFRQGLAELAATLRARAEKGR